MAGPDSYQHREEPKVKLKSAPEVSAPYCKQRQDVGMTLANDTCIPQTPEQKAQTERQKVDEYFKQMEYEFTSLGIKFAVDFYKGGYYALVAKDKRPPIEVVYARMKPFFIKSSESFVAKTILHDKSKDLLEILQFHLLCKDQEALQHETELLANIEAKILINSLEETIGTKFNDTQSRQFLSQLKLNGIDPKAANDLVEQIKKLSPENFQSLKGSKDLLLNNLVALVVICKALG